MSVIISARAVKIFKNPIKLINAYYTTNSIKYHHNNNTIRNFKRYTSIASPTVNFYRSCSQRTNMSRLSEWDPSSFSQPELVLTRHISMNLTVNFDAQIIQGSAVYTFNLQEACEAIVLDMKDQTIENIQTPEGIDLKYTIGETVPNFGSKLTIHLPKPSTEPKNGVCKKHYLRPNKLEKKEIKLTFRDKMYAPVRCGRLDDEYDATLVKGDSGQPCNTGGAKKCECCLCDKRIVPPPVDAYRMVLKITYKTSPCASALQWLVPEQTSMKKFPFMFSQCQPIHARSLIPCQDTPAVKFTYDAEIHADGEFTALMSAVRLGCTAGVTTFKQAVPIPSYLLAIACGALESHKLGPRTKLWAEVPDIDKAAWEFADTERFLQAAEAQCGPYVWDQYDLLVLPPSFPYGGMENPCLTFVTPTLISGDRSQADVIIHEIMHSWTGNLVTNRNFEHFWLNEGFTVFLERKVASKVEAGGEQNRGFSTMLGMKELSETVYHTLGPTNPLTVLVPDLTGVHPDEAFSIVPYEKGSLFLLYLENLFGGPETFDDFIRAYILKFQEKSISTLDFKLFLQEYFEGNRALKKIDWDYWLCSPGMPKAELIPDMNESKIAPVNKLIIDVENESDNYINEDLLLDPDNELNPKQKAYMLQELLSRPPIEKKKLIKLGLLYKLGSSKNTEIKFRWLRLNIKIRDETKVMEALDFVNKIGRMKYVRPLYRDLYAWPEKRQLTIENFLKNEKYMMSVVALNLRRDLQLGDWTKEHTCP